MRKALLLDFCVSFVLLGASSAIWAQQAPSTHVPLNQPFSSAPLPDSASQITQRDSPRMLRDSNYANHCELSQQPKESPQERLPILTTDLSPRDGL